MAADGVDAAARLRRTIFEAGMTAVAAATAYALVLVLVHGDWAERAVGVLVSGVFAAAVRERARVWALARRAPWAVVVAGALIGGVLVALGPDNRLLWLPAMLLVGSLAAAVPAPVVALAGLLAALGGASPLVLDRGLTTRETWFASAAALGLVVLPLVAAAIVARLDARVRENVAPAPPRVVAEGLTPRQREAVELAASGLRHAEIAARMGISIHQVRRLLREARERTGARTSRELVASSLRG